MPQTFFRHSIFFLYDRLWRVARPFLGLNARMATGYDQRVLKVGLPCSDIWIQAASAGESHLALLLARMLTRRRAVSILLTTTTKQAMDTIRLGLAGKEFVNSRVSAAYFPFDAPVTMKEAVDMVRPRVMVMLESEIWPGLLSALARGFCRVLVVNGRMTEKSLRRYCLWPSFWRALAPDEILAVSREDAKRFSRLFQASRVGIMSNMKFDRITPRPGDLETNSPPMTGIDPAASFIVLGSVRKQEEPVVERIISNIMNRREDVVFGVFPRHMHRIGHWEKRLSSLGISWRLRSKCTGGSISPNTVVLWDVFGELPRAYSRANAVFVGGGLAPLGGQNFLEALTCGVRPVIGPSWENFHWVGQAVVKEGLVRVARDWKAVAELLVGDLQRPPTREAVKKAVTRYVAARQGGTAEACVAIERLLREQ